MPCLRRRSSSLCPPPEPCIFAPVATRAHSRSKTGVALNCLHIVISVNSVFSAVNFCGNA